MKKVLLLSFLSLLLVTVFNTAIKAKKNGYTGKTSQTSNGCKCHGTTPSTATSLSVVSESGSFTVDAGSTTKFTVTINHSSLTSAGVNIAVKTTQTDTTSAGTLEPISGQSLQLMNGELTHTNPVPFSGGKVTFSFNWTAPSTPGDYYLRAIGLSSNNNNSKAGDQWNWLTPQKITVVKNSSITLTSPNGNESWCVGSTKQITWTSSGVNLVKILLSSDGGANFSTTIANSVDASTGLFNWNISPSLSAGNQYKIKLEDANDPNTSDISNANFALIEPTKITQQPPELVAVCAGQPINLSINASGQNLKYQWQKNGVDIANATQKTYSIQSAGASDAGNYRCVVDSDCGKIFSNDVTVTINTPPIVNSITKDTIICEGKPLVISVIATGSNLSYQWKKNGVNIPNSTQSSLSFPEVTKSQEGDYECVVTNSCGESVSPKTSIQVTKLPTITKQPVGATVNVGSQVTINVEAEGDDLKFEWKKDGKTIPNQNSNTLNLNNVNQSDAGEYTCVVSNLCAEVISSKAILNVTEVPAPLLSISLEKYVFKPTLLSSKKEIELKGFLRNIGNADLLINSIEIKGANAASFKIKSPVLPQQIKPQSSLDVTIEFNPLEKGNNIASLKISSNGGVIDNFILEGLGAEIKIGYESETQEFIAENPDKPIIKSFNIKNLSNTSINVTSNIVGNNGDFTLLSKSKFQLDVNEEYQYQVEYKPLSQKSSEAELNILIDEFDIIYKIDLVGKFEPKSIRDFSNQISIYPNPFNDIIVVALPSSITDKNLYLALYDNLGNVIIKDKQINSNVIELSDVMILRQLSQGLYFIVISSNSERILLPIIKH